MTKKTENDQDLTEDLAMPEEIESVQESEVGKDEGRYLIPRNFEISSLDESYKAMKELMSKGFNKFVVDGADVAIVDAAGIQLLIHFIRSLKSKGCVVSWDNYSVQVYQVAAELSLDEELGD